MTPLADIEVRDLRRDELGQAAELLARGMRDNPLHVAAYGPDPDRRLRCHHRLMRGLLRTSTTQRPIAALRDGVLVGVTGTAPPDTCQPTLGQRLRLAPYLPGLGPRTAGRVLRWTSRWAAHDLDEPHVHLGPLAVDAHLQGQGIGSRILAEHCRRLDHEGHVGYLETDKHINVGLYERVGYVVIAHGPVLGVPCWYMRRPVHADAPVRR